MSLLGEAFGVDSFPAGWETRPLHAVAIERRGNKNDGLLEENLLSLSYGSIVRKDINSDGGLLPESFEGYQIVEAGDLVMRLTDLQNDKRSLRSGLCNERGIITSAYLALEPRGIDPRYFAYLMRAYDTAKVLYPLGGGLRQSLKFEDVRMLPVLVPPVEEQRRIADFLDDQVARIDDINAARQRQAALARESTDSWLIDTFLTPSQNRIRVRALFLDERLGAWGDEPTGSGDVHVARVADFERDFYRLTLAPTMRHLGESQAASRLLRPGDILLERSGGGDDKPVGFAVLFQPDYIGRTVTSNFVSRLRPRDTTNPSYLRYVLAAMYQARWNAAHYTQTTGIQNLKSETYLRSEVPEVSLEAQRDLAVEADGVLSSMETQLNLLDRTVGLLEERKRALITAAVTGELDVATAKPIGMGKWVPNVGASVEALVAGQSSGIGEIG